MDICSFCGEKKESCESLSLPYLSKTLPETPILPPICEKCKEKLDRDGRITSPDGRSKYIIG